jgi:hypothetical protein
MSVRQSDILVKEFEGFHEVFEIEEWFSHSHKNNVGDSSFRQTLQQEVLANDFTGGEVSVESSETSGAEGASHRAADLAGDAAGDSVFVGEEDTLVDLVIAVVDEEFFDSVDRFSVGRYFEWRNFVVFGKDFSKVFRQVLHVIEIGFCAGVDVVRELFASHFRVFSVRE